MFDKILQKLKEQRGGTANVSDKSLEDLAKSLEAVITTDEQLAQANFTPAIQSISKNISHEASKAVKTEAQKAAEEAQRKAEEEAKKKQQQQQNNDGADGDEKIPPYIQAIIDSNKQMQETLAKFQGENTSKTRKQKLEKELETAPKWYKNNVLAAFDRLKFNDDDDFEKYVTEVKTTTANVIQEMKESGLPITTPHKDKTKQEESGETASLSDARKLVAEQKAKQQKQATE